MYEIVKFKEEHLHPLVGQSTNKNIEQWFTSGLSKHLEQVDSATVMYKGQVLMCGGITQYWKGRGQLWAVFNEETSKRNFVPAFRAIREWISYQIKNNYHRIEMSIDYGFDVGRRRAEMLGFNLEVERAKRYLPDGGDCTLYSLVRG